MRLLEFQFLESLLLSELPLFDVSVENWPIAISFEPCFALIREVLNVVLQTLLRILKEIRLLVAETIINRNALFNLWLEDRDVILEILHFFFKIIQFLLIFCLFFCKALENKLVFFNLEIHQAFECLMVLLVLNKCLFKRGHSIQALIFSLGFYQEIVKLNLSKFSHFSASDLFLLLHFLSLSLE